MRNCKHVTAFDNLLRQGAVRIAAGLVRCDRAAAIYCLIAFLALPVSAQPVVRVGYVVPQNRTPQPAAVDNLRDLIGSVQDWYADQMSRYGFGSKTFEIETELDGVTPKIHVVSTPVTDGTIRSDIWSQTINAASGAGLPIWTPGQVWLLVPEAHLQNPNGSIVGGTGLGASFGSGSDAGVAMLGSDLIFKASAAFLQNNTSYHGQVIPEIGPYPLVQDVSFPWFEGTTISSTASSGQGATAHELGHAFGLGHDFRNDVNFDGVVMGNGLRGYRGARLPSLFPDDDTQLSYAAALVLNESRYFNPYETVTNTVSPTLTIHTSGSVNPIDGLLQVSFTANDPTGLAVAILRRNGDTVAELPLSGTATTASLITPYYTPNQDDEFAVAVYDTFGNKRETQVTINVAGGFNRAPQPFVDVSRGTITLGEPVLLSAGQSTDPDGSVGSMLVEWDFNHDGIFDTTPSSTMSLFKVFDFPGDYLITARLTDALGASSISTPMVVRVISLAGDFDGDGDVDGRDFLVWQRNPSVGSLADWRTNFGQSSSPQSGPVGVPEPGTAAFAVLGLMALLGRRAVSQRAGR